MSDNITEQVRDIIADALELPTASVPLNASMETMDGWDSIKQLTIVMAVEDAFDLQLEPEEIAMVTSIAAIVERIEHGARAN